MADKTSFVIAGNFTSTALPQIENVFRTEGFVSYFNCRFDEESGKAEVFATVNRSITKEIEPELVAKILKIEGVERVNRYTEEDDRAKKLVA